MYVVIAGCGRVGSGLAKDLVAEGNEVSMIDENPDAFELLGLDFPGQFVIGAAIDWDVLRRPASSTPTRSWRRPTATTRTSCVRSSPRSSSA